MQVTWNLSTKKLTSTTPKKIKHFTQTSCFVQCVASELTILQTSKVIVWVTRNKLNLTNSHCAQSGQSSGKVRSFEHSDPCLSWPMHSTCKIIWCANYPGHLGSYNHIIFDDQHVSQIETCRFRRLLIFNFMFRQLFCKRLLEGYFAWRWSVSLMKALSTASFSIDSSFFSNFSAKLPYLAN